MMRRTSGFNDRTTTGVLLSNHLLRETSNIQIQVPIVVVIYESKPGVRAVTRYSRGTANVLESSVFLVVQQNDSAIKANSQIGRAVVIVIANSATGADSLSSIKPRFHGRIFKFSIPNIMIKAYPTLWTVIGNKDVEAAIPVIVKETGAGTRRLSRQTRVSSVRLSN